MEGKSLLSALKMICECHPQIHVLSFLLLLFFLSYKSGPKSVAGHNIMDGLNNSNEISCLNPL